MYLKFQDIQMVPKGPIYPKGTYRSQAYKRYLKVSGMQKVTKNSIYIIKVRKGPRYPKGI